MIKLNFIKTKIYILIQDVSNFLCYQVKQSALCSSRWHYFLTVLVVLLSSGTCLIANDKSKELASHSYSLNSKNYANFLQHEAKTDWCNFFEEREVSIVRIGTPGCYYYFIIQNSNFVAFVDAQNREKYYQWIHDYDLSGNQKNISNQDVITCPLEDLYLNDQHADLFLKSNIHLNEPQNNKSRACLSNEDISASQVFNENSETNSSIALENPGMLLFISCIIGGCAGGYIGGYLGGHQSFLHQSVKNKQKSDNIPKYVGGLSSNLSCSTLTDDNPTIHGIGSRATYKDYEKEDDVISAFDNTGNRNRLRPKSENHHAGISACISERLRNYSLIGHTSPTSPHELALIEEGHQAAIASQALIEEIPSTTHDYYLSFSQGNSTSSNSHDDGFHTFASEDPRFINDSQGGFSSQFNSQENEKNQFKNQDGVCSKRILFLISAIPLVGLTVSSASIILPFISFQNIINHPSTPTDNDALPSSFIPGVNFGVTPGFIPGCIPGFIPGQTPGVIPGATENFIPGIDGLSSTPNDVVFNPPGFIPGLDPGNIPGINPGTPPDINPENILSKIPDTVNEKLVKIGNPGNLPDPFFYPYYCGAVFYEFEISYEAITQQEWVQFLNSAAVKGDPYELYNEKMASFIQRQGEAGAYYYKLTDVSKNQKSMTCISYYSAQRYCNWNENGRKNANTEKGAYDLTDLQLNEIRTLNPTAHYHITNNDEYQKTHFYNPKALQNHGAYERKPINAYGTLAEEDTLNEWTSSIDPASNRPIIRGVSDNTYTTLNPKENREDIGFRIVKIIPTSCEKENEQQLHQMESEQLIAEARFHDQSNDQNDNYDNDRRDDWQGAAATIGKRIESFKEEKKALYEGRYDDAILFQNIGRGYEESVAFYIQSVVESFSKKDYSSQEVKKFGSTQEVKQYCLSQEIKAWYNAGLYLETANSDLVKKKYHCSNMYRDSALLAIQCAKNASEGLVTASAQVGLKAYINAVNADNMTD